MLHEIYLGKQEDQIYIREFLKLVRSIDPIEISTVPSFFRLNEKDKLQELIDYNVLINIINQANDIIINKYSDCYHPIAHDRYLIGLVMDDTSIGGFHDAKSFGYHFYYAAGFVLLINPKLVKNRLIRTVELARNYIHDCLHHSTFRSYRRKDKFPAKNKKVAKTSLPELYREQYGINFRNQEGISYSSVELTKKSPHAINLNLLMDGSVVLTVASILEDIGAINLVDAFEGNIEKNVWNDIFLRDFEYENYHMASIFKQNIQIPTQCFIDYWGGHILLKLIIKSMFSGELDELKEFFSNKSHKPNAWENIFKRPGFEL